MKKEETKEETKEEVKEVEKKVGAKALAVYTMKNQYVRTFSAELHGLDFVKLAEGFAKKIGGKVEKAG